MTVKELIEALSKLPDDVHVVLPGYEGGSDIVQEVEKVPSTYVAMNTEWWYGKFEKAPAKDAEEGEEIITAVSIG